VAAPSKRIPEPTPQTSLRALRAIIRGRSVFPGLQVFHQETGSIFQINAPSFHPVMMVGPDACRFVLINARDDLRWRMEGDSVTTLLIHGVLVEDGESHDEIRRNLNPALHKRMLGGYVDAMVRRTDQVAAGWVDDCPVDMLVEMRKVALLILMDALFEVDFTPELRRLWWSVLYLIQYISPGLWLFWRGAPRPGYRQARAQMDQYLFRIIQLRRDQLKHESDYAGTDMLSVLIHAGMPDDLIRDQLMTMLIAGHDTSTASLAWSLYLLGAHPDAQARARAEIDAVLGDTPPTAETYPQLTYLEQVMNETLRLYPPIHLGSRLAARDLEFDGYSIAKGTRVLYSIYLTQRNPEYWPEPDRFDPERFAPHIKHEPYNFLPFGGGPRNCIGMAFAQVEMRVVLARLLQRFTLERRFKDVHLHMGATLEPRPGVLMQPIRRP
jgi:cytochrome P450